MNEKVKKGIIVAASIALGIVLVVMIAGNFKKPQKAEDKLAESQSTEIEVKPEIKKSELDKKAKETEPKKAESEKASSQETENDKPSESSTETDKEGNQDNGQPAQSLQPRVTKPEPPAQEVLENPAQKPNGESVGGTPVPENHDEVQKPEPDAVPGAAPEGETQEGKIYAPGFGWIDDIGEGEGVEDDGIYENGNKIGVMD